MRLVAGLVVGRVEVVHAALQTGVHDGEVLIRESEVNGHQWLLAAEKLAERLHGVGVDSRRGDDRQLAPLLFGGALYGGLHRVALGEGARGDYNFGEHVGVLRALVCAHGAHATATYDNNFSHLFSVKSLVVDFSLH